MPLPGWVAELVGYAVLGAFLGVVSVTGWPPSELRSGPGRDLVALASVLLAGGGFVVADRLGEPGRRGPPWLRFPVGASGGLAYVGVRIWS